MKNEKYTDLRPCAVGEGMPLPAMHLQPVQTAVKMVNASELSLRGPEGAVAISQYTDG